jgi:hypothetical protein
MEVGLIMAKTNKHRRKRLKRIAVTITVVAGAANAVAQLCITVLHH